MIPLSGEVEDIINAGRSRSEPLVTACLGASSLDWFFSSCCTQNKSATVLKFLMAAQGSLLQKVTQNLIQSEKRFCLDANSFGKFHQGISTHMTYLTGIKIGK